MFTDVVTKQRRLWSNYVIVGKNKIVNVEVEWLMFVLKRIFLIILLNVSFKTLISYNSREPLAPKYQI